MWAENRRELLKELLVPKKKQGLGEGHLYTLKQTTQRLSMNAQIKTLYITKVHRISEDTYQSHNALHMT